MHLIAYLKLFFSLLDIFLNQDKVLKMDLVLPKWSKTPLSIGYPIDKGVFDHLGRTKSILSTLSWFKKISNNEKKSFK